MIRSVAIALSFVVWGCAGETEGRALRFVAVPAPAAERAIRVDGETAAIARVRLLDALDDADGALALVGGEGWETVAVVASGKTVDEAVASARTYVRNGGGLRLDVRLGAGDRGAFSGGVVPTGAERAMIQVRLEDPDTLEARFRLAIYADDGPRGAPPRNVTPRYLARPLPRGTYRAGVDVPPRGGRFLVEAVTLDRRGHAVAYGWASPIAVERPWL